MSDDSKSSNSDVSAQQTAQDDAAIRVTPNGGTRYKECPDYPGVCCEFPGACRGETRTMASFRRIG
jgi:hypothetical protein